MFSRKLLKLRVSNLYNNFFPLAAYLSKILRADRMPGGLHHADVET